MPTEDPVNSLRLTLVSLSLTLLTATATAQTWSYPEWEVDLDGLRPGSYLVRAYAVDGEESVVVRLTVVR